jgi:L-malate glycosyltransferase
VTVLYAQSLSNLSHVIETEQHHSENLDEIIVYYRKNTGIFHQFINLIRYLMAIRKGLELIRQKSPSPDLIHAYILLRTGFVAWFLSAKTKVPFIVSEQWSGYVTGKYSAKSLLRKTLTKWIIKRAAAVTSVSEFLLRGMENNGLRNNRTFIIPNCIEISESVEKRTAANPVYVLLVADLIDEIKNISAVIRMVGSLESQRAFELHIVGHGRDEKMLKEIAVSSKAGDKVIFEGLKTNEQVYEYLRRCDFLVMNSRYETFSLICAEAMSCGKPVIATRCGGPDEFVIRETGVLIRPDDESELRLEFTRMLSNFQQYDAQKIIAHARKLFSSEVASAGFENVYETVLNSANEA